MTIKQLKKPGCGNNSGISSSQIRLSSFARSPPSGAASFLSENFCPVRVWRDALRTAGKNVKVFPLSADFIYYIPRLSPTRPKPFRPSSSIARFHPSGTALFSVSGQASSCFCQYSAQRELFLAALWWEKDYFAPAVFSGIDVQLYTGYNVGNASFHGAGLPHRKKRVH